MTKYYQIDWGNGNTDVFLDQMEAIICYEDHPDEDIREAVASCGEWTEKPTPPEYGAEWSEAALERWNEDA